MASAGVVNIRRDVDDKFYRYRMPILQTKIEGKGNGIKTVLPNMSDVARALSRPPTYSTKFFGCELGAQTSFDEKNDRYIVNGAHDANRLRDLLDGFIDKFVLCAECKNPETDLYLTKTEDIYRDCKACGARTPVDMRHKLVAFILRNPPKKAKKSKKVEGADGAEKDGEEGGSADPAGAGDDGSDDEITKRITGDAAALPTAEQLALANGVASLNIEGEEGSDEGGDSPYEQFILWLEESKAEEIRAISADDVVKKAQELHIDLKHKTIQILAERLFTEKALSEIPKFEAAFKKLVTSEKHQKALLGGMEKLVGVVYPNLTQSVPKILMAFYQADILEEEIITHWATHVSKKYVDRDVSKKVRKAADPFMKWLQEADEDDDEE